MTVGWTIVACMAGVLCGVLLGCGAVVCFNRLPGRWLCDYDEEPDEELAHPTRQRVRSTPWKYVFSALFAVLAIYLFVGGRDALAALFTAGDAAAGGQMAEIAGQTGGAAGFGALFGMAGFTKMLSNMGYGLAVLAALWLLLLMSVADVKYRIVPDQLVLLLAVCGCGFIPFHPGGPLSGIWGGLAGMGIFLLIALLGRLLFHRETVGGGDMKLFGALGLCTGLSGVLTVFVLTSLLSAAHFVWLLARRRAKPTDRRPLVPYIAISAGLYLVLLSGAPFTIWIDL